MKALDTQAIIDGVYLDPVVARITTTPLLATEVAASRRTPSRSSPTTRMCNRT